VPGAVRRPEGACPSHRKERGGRVPRLTADSADGLLRYAPTTSRQTHPFAISMKVNTQIHLLLPSGCLAVKTKQKYACMRH
jgi:hypothetical protein